MDVADLGGDLGTGAGFVVLGGLLDLGEVFLLDAEVAGELAAIFQLVSVGPAGDGFLGVAGDPRGEEEEVGELVLDGGAGEGVAAAAGHAEHALRLVGGAGLDADGLVTDGEVEDGGDEGGESGAEDAFDGMGRMGRIGPIDADALLAEFEGGGGGHEGGVGVEHGVYLVHGGFREVEEFLGGVFHADPAPVTLGILAADDGVEEQCAGAEGHLDLGGGGGGRDGQGLMGGESAVGGFPVGGGHAGGERLVREGDGVAEHGEASGAQEIVGFLGGPLVGAVVAEGGVGGDEERRFRREPRVKSQETRGRVFFLDSGFWILVSRQRKRAVPHEAEGGFLVGKGGDGDAEFLAAFVDDLLVEAAGGDDEGEAGVLEEGQAEDGHGLAHAGIPADDAAVVHGGAGEVVVLVAAEGEARVQRQDSRVKRERCHFFGGGGVEFHGGIGVGVVVGDGDGAVLDDGAEVGVEFFAGHAGTAGVEAAIAAADDAPAVVIAGEVHAAGGEVGDDAVVVGGVGFDDLPDAGK